MCRIEQVPSWKFWHHPKKLKSTAWLLEVMTRPEVADTRPIFLIHHAELLGELRLQNKGVDKSGLRYYTFNELKPLLGEINDQARRAGEAKSDAQDAFQKQVEKLANALWLYQRLKFTLQPEGADNFARELADFQKNLGPAQVAAQASDSGKPFDKEALARIAQPVQDFQTMAQFGYPLVVPPLDPTDSQRPLANDGRQPAWIPATRTSCIPPRWTSPPWPPPIASTIPRPSIAPWTATGNG